MLQAEEPQADFSLAQTRHIVKDLFTPNPWIYWSDFLCSLLGGAIGFAGAGALGGFGLGAATVTAGATGLDVAASFGCNHLVNCGPAEVGRRFFAGCSI